MSQVDVAMRSWVDAHPYLKSIAQFHSALEATVSRAAIDSVPLPDFNTFRREFAEGTPLLRSSCRLQFAKPATTLVGRLAETTAAENASEKVTQAAREIQTWTTQEPEEAQNVIEQLILGRDIEDVTRGPELLRLLTWTAMRRVLQEVTRSYDDWRSGKTWMREYCPTCGVLPVLAQLLSMGNARERAFVCGRCQTQWIYKRIGCPYCRSTNPSSMVVLEIEGENSLRLDACNECKGYTKTYTGTGQETMFRADWTTLHLDALATQQGFARLGTSLYEI
jgi:FdhE protein